MSGETSLAVDAEAVEAGSDVPKSPVQPEWELLV